MMSQPLPGLADQHDGPGTVLRLPALEVRQGDGSTLYSFAVDGKQLSLFTTISRIHRDDDSEIQGYQRPAVLTHINAIRRYIESDAPMIPNALVIAFDKRVQFEPLGEASARPTPGTGLSRSRSARTHRRRTSPGGSSTASSAVRRSATPAWTVSRSASRRSSQDLMRSSAPSSSSSTPLSHCPRA